jgi:hypothetical protein
MAKVMEPDVRQRLVLPIVVGVMSLVISDDAVSAWRGSPQAVENT